MSEQEKKEPKIRYHAFWGEKDHQQLTDWWTWLENNRGERAQLRRCENPEQVLPQVAFHQLCRRLPYREREDVLALATVAGLLAHIKESSNQPLMAQLGQSREGGDKPVLSELRFQQLISSENSDELYDRMRRVIQLVGNKANIISVADIVFHWSRDQKQSERNPTNRFHYSCSKAYFNELFKYQKTN